MSNIVTWKIQTKDGYCWNDDRRTWVLFNAEATEYPNFQSAAQKAALRHLYRGDTRGEYRPITIAPVE